MPTLVVLVADNYQGHQQAKALGWLGGAPAMGIITRSCSPDPLTGWSAGEPYLNYCALASGTVEVQ